MSGARFCNVLSTSSLQQAANTVHGQLCLLLLGKGKQSQMPYRKVNGSLLFFGKAASFLGVFSRTGVLLWRGSVIHAGEGERCALHFTFGFVGTFLCSENGDLWQSTLVLGWKLLVFFSHWLASNRSSHLHSCSFHLLMVPSWALSKGSAFRSDLILFHTQELHYTWQVLGIQPGQEVPGLNQGSPGSVILQPKELCEALSIMAFMCYHYRSILSVWDCFPLITSLNQY